MEVLAPWSLLGLVLVPAVFLWGLWAPRGRRLVVGSLLVWRRVMGAGPTGRPSARIRLRNPLLWLDAAAILLLVLACARPAFHTRAAEGPVATLVLDRSASMRTDLGQGPRWQRARAMVEPLLREAGQEPLRVVSVPGGTGGVTSAVLTAREALGEDDEPWRPLLVAANVWDFAAPEAARDAGLPVLVATDVPPAAPMPKNVYVMARGGPSRNVGIVRVATRAEGGRWWLLAAARAAEGAKEPCGLQVWGPAGQSILREGRFLAPGQSVEKVLAMPGAPPAQVHVALVAADGRSPVEDGFPADNDAYLAWQPAQHLRVLVAGQPDEALHRAMAARDDTTVFASANPDEVSPGDADLVVAVGAGLPNGWKGPAVLVTPPAGAGPVTPLAGEARADWTVVTTHPLAEALYLEPPRIGAVRPYRLEPGAVLVLGTPEVPLVATWQVDGHRRLAVLFPLDQQTTDWTRRAGFPVFWRRALDWLVPQSGRSGRHVTYLPFEVPPGAAKPAPGVPGIHPAEGGRRQGVSFIGTDEGFQAGPSRDDSAEALVAIRASLGGRHREATREVWPWLAAAILALVLAREWVAR